MDVNSFIDTHYRENYKKSVNRMLGRVPDRSRHLAEEVVQEAYYRVIKYFDNYKPSKEGFEPWFNRILFNCANDCKSKERSRGVVDNNVNVEHVLEEISFDIDTKIYLKNYLKGKSEIENTILTLVFFKGLTTKEVSECIGKSDGAVRMILMRFRKDLRGER